MDDYLKLLIEEIKKEKIINFNQNTEEKKSKQVITPISFIEKEDRLSIDITQNEPVKKENDIDLPSLSDEKQNIIVAPSYSLDDKNESSIISFEASYDLKNDSNIEIENTEINS
jgi:hypothetical protein